jgi:hypothetical protein
MCVCAYLHTCRRQGTYAKKRSPHTKAYTIGQDGDFSRSAYPHTSRRTRAHTVVEPNVHGTWHPAQHSSAGRVLCRSLLGSTVHAAGTTTSAAHRRGQPPSKGSLRGSKCTPLCNSQLPACKPIVCRRSQVSKSYIDAERHHQRSSVPDTCCMMPRARALSACMQ